MKLNLWKFCLRVNKLFNTNSSSSSYFTHLFFVSRVFLGVFYLDQYLQYINILMKFSSPGLPGHRLRLHGKHQTESCSNTSRGLMPATRFTAVSISRMNSVTWENKDEEGADPSDDTDDLAYVWYKHSDEQRHGNPQDRQHVPTATFKLQCPHAITPPPPAQQGVLDYRSNE